MSDYEKPTSQARRRKPRPFLERFWERVSKGGADECWTWTKGGNGDGYGTICMDGSRTPMNASRASWILHNGPIADGLHVLHRCDNPPCVNPAHLFLGTNRDNVQDAIAKGRRHAPVMRGEEQPRAKLTEDAVRQIRALAQTHRTGRLAAMFGVCAETIRTVVRGTAWSHVQPRDMGSRRDAAELPRVGAEGSARGGREGAPCAEPGCPERGIVGLGATPAWLCLAHFDARLKATRERLAAAFARASEDGR